MNARCRTARVSSPSSPSESIGDPISNNGFEFFHQFSAPGLAIGLVEIPFCLVKCYRSTFTLFCKHRVRFPRHPFSFNCSRRVVHTSTKPILVSVELPLLLLLLSAARGTSGCSPRLFDSPCCSTVASVISASCSKLRFANGGGSSGGGAGANAEPLLLLPPSW